MSMCDTIVVNLSKMLNVAAPPSSHTGTIDAAWTSCKKIIPNSLGAKHKDVMLYAKMWQWRFVNKYKKLLEKTVEMLRQMK